MDRRKEARSSTPSVHESDRPSPLTIVIDDFGIGNRSGLLNDGAADRVDPILLLLLGIGDEVHSLSIGGELESEGFVEDVFGALDGEAIADGDDAAGLGGSVHV